MFDTSLARRYLWPALPLAVLSLLIVLVFAGTAWADGSVPAPRPGLVVDSIQFWTLAVGSIVPLVSYLVNHYGPHLDEKVKGVVFVVVAAIAGALYPLIQSGDWAFDTKHLELVGSAVLAALVAHHTLWRPSGISTALGAGSNAQDDLSR